MKLNLGCGRDIKEGWVNVDYVAHAGVDKVVNLNILPYDFQDSSVDEIHCSHVLEHLNEPIEVMKELARIVKMGGKVTIIVPHYTSPGAYSPLHKTFWHSRFFDHFIQIDYWKTGSCEEHIPLFSSLKKHIRFPKGLMLWNYPVEWFVNLNSKTQLIYENHFLFWFPAQEIRAEFVK